MINFNYFHHEELQCNYFNYSVYFVTSFQCISEQITEHGISAVQYRQSSYSSKQKMKYLTLTKSFSILVKLTTVFLTLVVGTLILTRTYLRTQIFFLKNSHRHTVFQQGVLFLKRNWCIADLGSSIQMSLINMYLHLHCQNLLLLSSRAIIYQLFFDYDFSKRRSNP